MPTPEEILEAAEAEAAKITQAAVDKMTPQGAKNVGAVIADNPNFSDVVKQQLAGKAAGKT